MGKRVSPILIMFRNFLQYILAILARLMLGRYKPKVIGITGNVGKTSVKDAVYAVVSFKFKTRKSEKSYNNEIGVPLTILGIASAGKNIFGWLWRLLKVVKYLIHSKYPEVLVLEMGVEKPMDMSYLLKIVQPDIAVFTSIGDIPAHVENFSSREALIKEKLKLASAVGKTGHVIFNEDVPAWQNIREKARAQTITYGFSEQADVKISTLERRVFEQDGKMAPLGITFKIDYKGTFVPFRMDGVFSSDGAYSGGAACAIGAALGINLIDIASSLVHYTPPRGRLNLHEGVKGSLILDDTYNASPSSMYSALAVLSELPAKRKIAALGDMLELGEYSEEAHRETGRQAAKICDLIFLVGSRMRFAEDEAIAKGFIKNKNIFVFDTSEEAGKTLREIIKEGDLILAKGSQAIRMEKAVRRIIAHPDKAVELLVRQDPEWQKS